MISRLFLFSLMAVAGNLPNDIRCMNFYGLETGSRDVVCGWQHRPRWYLDKLQSNMYINTIRLPFSYEYVREAQWQHMDEIIGECETLGIRVILDYHRTWNTHQGPIPEELISREEFIQAWLTVLGRYLNYSVLFGVGVFNEIQAINDFIYTHNLHREVVSAIEANFPGRFYYFLGCPNWGGNCSDMEELKDMPTWNRTYIEVHKYSFSGTPGPKDWSLSIPDSIAPEHWFIGEMGWKMGEPLQVEWATKFIEFLRERSIYNACMWTIAHSGDTEGWWKDDCETFDWDKARMSACIWYDPEPRYLRGSESTILLPPVSPDQSPATLPYGDSD